MGFFTPPEAIEPENFSEVAQLIDACLIENQVNLESGFLLSPHGESHFQRRFDQGAHLRGIRTKDGDLVGFMLGIPTLLEESNRRDQAYWLERFPDLENKPRHYIDQVAIHPAHRKSGLGSLLYEDFLSTVSDGDHVGAIIIQRPYNGASVKFHEAFDFRLAKTVAEPVGGVHSPYGFYVR